MTRNAAIIIALLAVAMAGRAQAMTSDGVLITNMASASYWSADGAKYSPTYGVTANVLVSNPAISLTKSASPSMQCSGGTVTFCIYAINTSAISSSFNIVVEDWLPIDSVYQNGMSFIIGSRTVWNPQAVTITPGFSWYVVGPGWRTWYPPTDADGDPDLIGQYYIRWAISTIGPGKSVMLCYKASVL